MQTLQQLALNLIDRFEMCGSDGIGFGDKPNILFPINIGKETMPAYNNFYEKHYRAELSRENSSYNHKFNNFLVDSTAKRDAENYAKSVKRGLRQQLKGICYGVLRKTSNLSVTQTNNIKFLIETDRFFEALSIMDFWSNIVLLEPIETSEGADAGVRRIKVPEIKEEDETKDEDENKGGDSDFSY